MNVQTFNNMSSWISAEPSLKNKVLLQAYYYRSESFDIKKFFLNSHFLSIFLPSLHFTVLFFNIIFVTIFRCYNALCLFILSCKLFPTLLNLLISKPLGCLHTGNFSLFLQLFI